MDKIYTLEEKKALIAEQKAKGAASKSNSSFANAMNEVRKYAPILEVVQRSGLVLRQKDNGYWVCKSPFKKDDPNEESFVVNPPRNIYYDYASGIGGDAIDYIAHTHHCTPKEALDFLVKEFKES